MFWYAIKTRSRHEKIAETALEGRGFEVFLPLYKTLRIWSDRRRELLVPLFSGYLFVKCEMNSSIKTQILNSSKGVVSIIGFRGKSIPVPDREIESIKLLLQKNDKVTPIARIVKGKKVRIISGPLKGVEGIFKELKGKRKIICLIELLGRSVEAEFLEGDIIPVNEDLKL